MKPVSIGVFVAGLLAFALSLLMPANRDWLGFLWAAFALEVVLRGPQGSADYPLFLLVSAGNLVLLVSPLAFAGPRMLGRIVALLCAAATGGAIYACLRYHPETWANGYYTWCAALLLVTVALFLRSTAGAPRAARAAPAGTRPLGALRRTGTK